MKLVKCRVGIECVPELVQKAQKNAERMRFRKTPIEFHCMDAINAEYSDGTVYIFYNPFGADTLRSVLQKIKLSLEHSPRRIRLAYFNPVHESVIKECGWLSCIGQHQPWSSGVHASYWTNV